MLIKFTSDRNLREIAMLVMGEMIWIQASLWSCGFISCICVCPVHCVNVPFSLSPLVLPLRCHFPSPCVCPPLCSVLPARQNKYPVSSHCSLALCRGCNFHLFPLSSHWFSHNLKELNTFEAFRLNQIERQMSSEKIEGNRKKNHVDKATAYIYMFCFLRNHVENRMQFHLQ